MQMWREQLVLLLSSVGFDNNRLLILAVLVMVSVVSVGMLFRTLLRLLFRSLKQTAYFDYIDFWYNFVLRVRLSMIIVVAMAAGSLFIPLTPLLSRLLDTMFLVAFVFLLVSLIQSTFFDFATYMMKYVPGRGEKPVDKTAITFVKVLLAMLLWLITVVVVLRAWDYDITMLLGGLGVASIIISLSAQNFLKDVFGFFTIYVDKSFAVGDYVESGEYRGIVRDIRLRTTRIVARPSGQDMIVPNSVLTSQAIYNYADLPARRTHLDYHCVTSTPPEKLEKVVTDIKAWFGNEDELVQLDFVHFREARELSFMVTVVYHFHDGSLEKGLDQRERVNLAVVRIFRKHGVKFTNRADRIIEKA